MSVPNLSMKALLFFSLILMGCQSTPQKEVVSEAQTSPMAAVFESHGGLDTWQEQRSLQFSIPASKEEFTLDLHKRYERIEGEGYTLGYDGNEYWADVRDTAVGDKNAKFLINLQFYFFAMPFVLADEGVHIEQLKSRDLGEKSYKVYLATFGDGIGVAPEDQYVVYVDPTTDRMEYLLYSVTFFNPANSEKYGALHYHRWQQIGGLWLPSSATRYRWNSEDQTLGESRGEKIFSRVRLSKEAPEMTIFQR